MYEADDLLVAMEVQAAKFINTDRLKSLFRWAKRITDTTNNQYNGLTRRTFALHQYFLLNLLNKFHETVKYKTGPFQDLDLIPHSYFYRDNYHLYLDLDQDIYPDLYLDLSLYFYQIRHFTPNLLLHHDFYRYMDADFHSSDFSKFGNRFDRELSERIKAVERVKEKNIFKGVDLQRMIQRFDEEREFIKAVRKGDSVGLPTESIHDTWLAVLGITDDMLAISDEELESCHRYLRAVQLIVACKEAAGRVSSDVWQGIEEKLLA